MSPQSYSISDWSEFQHYKDRSPTWVKLHKKYLDDYDFHSLPVASRALAPMLWLLASEHPNIKSGLIDGTDEKIAFRLRMTVDDFREAIKHLIDKGFIIYKDSCINSLADTYHSASPEERRGEDINKKEENREEKKISPFEASIMFEEFWSEYPKQTRKGFAFTEYKKAIEHTKHETIISALRRYTFNDEVKFCPKPEDWLKGECWLDGSLKQDNNPQESPNDKAQRLKLEHYKKTGQWLEIWGEKPSEVA